MSASTAIAAPNANDAATQGDAACPLTMNGVSKRWGEDQAPVLDRVHLQLEPATRTWVGGRNGAGKTTMLRVAAGLIDPDSGRAEVWGLTARENARRYRRLVSFLPAGDRGLYARLTVRKQLEFWARLALVPRERFGGAIDHAMQAFALRELADRRVDRMSMGQRQRLRIAMTFLSEPEIVLLDEPLSSLDDDGAELLEQAIDGLVRREGLVLWCSPSGERPQGCFDAHWTLQQGRLAPA